MLGYQGMHLLLLLLLLLLSFTTHKVNKIRSLQIGEKSDDDDDTPKNEKKKVANIGVYHYSKQPFYLLILVPFIFMLSCRWNMYLT